MGVDGGAGVRVNPARAGMILAGGAVRRRPAGKPRASGDDPAIPVPVEELPL